MGVDLLMSDSTNAETPGVTRSEASVGPALRDIIENAEQRVIAASFSSHIHRVQQICDAAVGAGRKVVVTGRSMITNTKIARELGYLDIDDDDIVDAYEASSLPPEKVRGDVHRQPGRAALGAGAHGERRPQDGHRRARRHRRHRRHPGAGQREGRQPRHQPAGQGRRHRGPQGQRARARLGPRAPPRNSS